MRTDPCSAPWLDECSLCQHSGGRARLSLIPQPPGFRGDRKDKPRGPSGQWDGRYAGTVGRGETSTGTHAHTCTRFLPHRALVLVPQGRGCSVSSVPLKSEPRDRILCLTVNLKLQAGSLPQGLEIPLLLVVTGTGKKWGSLPTCRKFHQSALPAGLCPSLQRGRVPRGGVEPPGSLLYTHVRASIVPLSH